MSWDLAATRRHLEAQRARKLALGALRAAEARARLAECAQLLRQRYGVARVWWFGSLARGQGQEHSDVDIAVTELSPREHMRATSDLEQLFGMRVDLVRLEEASGSLRDRVLDEGIAL